MTVSLSLRHIFLLGIIIITAVYGVVQYVTFKNNSITVVQDMQADNARVVADASLRDIKILVSEYEILLQTAADMITERNEFDQATINQTLLPIFTHFSDLSAIFYGGKDNGLIGYRRVNDKVSQMRVFPDDASKTIYFTSLNAEDDSTGTSSRDDFNTTQRPWYQVAIKSKGPVWSSRFYYHLDQSEAIPLSVVIKDKKGDVKGVLGVNLFMSTVNALFASNTSGGELYNALLNSKNETLAESIELNKWRPEHASQLSSTLDSAQSDTKLGFLSSGESHFYFHETPITDLAGDKYSVLTILDMTPSLSSSLTSIRNIALTNILVALATSAIFYLYLVKIADKLTPTLHLLRSQRFLDKQAPPITASNQQIRVKEFDDVHDALVSAHNESKAIYKDLEAAQEQIIMYLQTVKRLARVSEMTEDLVVVIHADGKIKWCNTSFQTFFQPSPTFESQQNVFSMMEDSGLYGISAIELHQKVTSDIPMSLLEICFSQGDNNIYFTIEAKHYQPTDSAETELFLLLSNVTRYKEQQQTLMLWKTIFDQAKWGIAISRHGSQVFDQVNRALCNITGYTASELRDTPVDAIMSKEMAEQFPTYYLEATRSGFVSYQGDLINKLGIRVPVLVSVSTVTNEDDEPIYRIASIQDLTSQVDLTHRIEHQSRLSVLGELTSGIVHDFNNILGTITFNNALITLAAEEASIKAPLGESFKKVISLSEKIDVSVNAVSALIDQILVFARQQTNKTSNINLNEVIKETLDITFRKSAESCHIEFISELEDAYIIGVKSQLIQLILNLITNAEKSINRAQREKGLIRIGLSRKDRLEKDGNFVCLDVEDNGEGIVAALLPRIFDAFKTFDGDNASTGIGLALVKRVAELHNGWVEVHSEETKGTTFSAYFPLITTVSSLSDNTQTLESKPTQTESDISLNFVVVEDEEPLLESFKKLLEHCGHSVKPFYDSEQALTYLKHNSSNTDVLLTDYVMPNMNGKTLVERIQEFAPTLPIIVMTGYADAVDEQEFIDAGANLVMIKPVKISNLLSMLSDNLLIGKTINERSSKRS